MPRRLTTEEFKNQLSIEHPELELIGEYNGNKNYVTVRCVRHNRFFNSKPNWLHHGAGCIECYNDRRGKSQLKSQEQFIGEISKIYEGKKYDLSKVNYVNCHTNVCVICPKHGEFYPRPDHIINRGDGCPKCRDEYIGSLKRLPLSDFIRRAREVHGDKYDYSQVEYVNIDTPVKIICPEHGEFWQTPYTHLDGSGCPVCSESQLEEAVRLKLIEQNIEYIPQYKEKWLGGKSLDFYLPNSIAIECQGLQHFMPVDFFGGEDEFQKRLVRDNDKYYDCRNHYIDIYYVVDDDCNVDFQDSQFNGIYDNGNVIKKGNLAFFLRSFTQKPDKLTIYR